MARSNVEKIIKDIEDESFCIILFTSVSLHCNVGPIYMTHIGTSMITLQPIY